MTRVHVGKHLSTLFSVNFVRHGFALHAVAKLSEDVLGKIDGLISIHWFCACCDELVMG